MAVQAQYPSNVLLLNRSIQEGKNPIGNNDYSLQPQPGGEGGGGGGGGGSGGGAMFDQTHMLFNHGVGANNPRKRGREMIINSSNPLMSMALQHQSQQQHPQIVDLSQLHTPQNNPNNVVSTGLRLAFGDQQQHQLQQQQQQQQQQHSQPQQQHHSLSPQSSVQSSVLLSMLSDDFASHINQHREEIDKFLHIQGEQLRRGLAEKRQRHYREILGTAEETVARRLREKEMEVEKAIRRNADLEARAAQLSAEAQAWQARARAQEMAAATLQAQLQQAMLRGGGGRGGGSGGGGGCSGEMDEWGGGNNVGEAAEDAESAYIDPDRVAVLTGPSCKACRKRVASVVLLPCRHLCLCSECDTVAQACPLCLTFRSSSVEVNLC